LLLVEKFDILVHDWVTHTERNKMSERVRPVVYILDMQVTNVNPAFPLEQNSGSLFHRGFCISGEVDACTTYTCISLWYYKHKIPCE